MNAIRRVLVMACFGVLAACGGGGGGDSAPVGPPPPPAATADVTVTVADTLGRFVAGAVVTATSSGANAATDASGKATLKVPVGSEQVLTIAAGGFAEQVKAVTLDAAATRGNLAVLVVAREPAVALVGIEAGGSVTGKHGVKVEFPAAALVDGAGLPVSGSIDLFMTPIDVSLSDVGAFPGLFEGTAAGVARGPIVTLGTAELVPQQGGQKLQLAAGKTATIELPIYVTTLFDGTTIKAGDTIPVWSLSGTTGLWTQEGTGTVVASAASPTGLALRAAIAHFSWWNVDQFAQRATVDVSVTASGTTVPAGTLATVTAQVVSGTGPTSTASLEVTVGGPAHSVQVAAPATLKFSTTFDAGAFTCSGSTNAGVTPGSNATAAIAALCVQVPVPNIVVPAALSSTNSSAPTRVQIVVDGPQPDSVELLANGVVVQTFGPQFFYVHQLDTTTMPEGTTTLQARATLAGVARSGNSVALVIDRTPPRATQILPAPGVQVNNSTTFTVSFDEPVNPVPFLLTDAVKLSVMPVGQSTPTIVAADVRLDTAGLTLTVTPLAALPLGTVGLSWGGLHDAARNDVTGTVAASWTVDRSDFIGPALSHDSTTSSFMGASLAIGPDGSLLAAHRPESGSAISLSRYDSASNTWVVVAPAVNERPARSLLQLAIDSNGVAYVAFVQQTAANPAAFELVMKRLAGGILEPAAPAVPLQGDRGQDVNQGSMAIDASNRPVLVFSDPNASNVRLFRLEQGVLVSPGIIAQLAFDPHLSLQADGTILVTHLKGFSGSNGGTLVVVSVVNGIVRQIGPGIDSVPDATQRIDTPRVLARGNEPWVFWSKAAGGARATHAARFDGTRWVETPFPAPVQGNELAVGLLAGDPVLAASNGGLGTQVLRFRNDAWEAGFDATPRGGFGDRMELAIRGTDVALISSRNGMRIAEVQRLRFP